MVWRFNDQPQQPGEETSTQTSHDSSSTTVTTNYIWLYIRSKFNVTVYNNLPPEFESLGIMLILLSHHPSYNIVHVYSIKRLIIEVTKIMGKGW